MKVFKIILILVLLLSLSFTVCGSYNQPYTQEEIRKWQESLGASSAILSDETLEIVNSLRWKHSFGALICIDSDNVLYDDSDFEYEWWSYWFEDGVFYVETQDGKWFVEMEKMEE